MRLNPDGLFMMELYPTLEMFGEYMKANGLTSLDIPIPPPTAEDHAREAAVQRMATAAADYPARLLMGIIAGKR